MFLMMSIVIIVVLFGINKELRHIRYILQDIQHKTAINSDIEEQ